MVAACAPGFATDTAAIGRSLRRRCSSAATSVGPSHGCSGHVNQESPSASTPMPPAARKRADRYAFAYRRTRASMLCDVLIRGSRGDPTLAMKITRGAMTRRWGATRRHDPVCFAVLAASNPMSPRDTMSIAVLASGEGTNLQVLLDAQREERLPIRVAGVFGDRPAARALERARRYGLEPRAIEPREFSDRQSFDEALFALVDAVEPDLVVCAGYMRLISAPVVERYVGRIVNIHPSLLPKYQGLRTHARPVPAGGSQHGAGSHYVTAELDGGPAPSRI